MQPESQWRGIRYYELQAERDEAIAIALAIGLSAVGIAIAAWLSSLL